VSKRVLLKDVAKAASVSEATASLALADAPQVNDMTRMRVQQLSREMNYRPRRRKPVRSEPNTPTNRRIGLVRLSPHADELLFVENLKRLDKLRSELGIRLELTMIQDTDPGLTRHRLEEAAEEVDGLLLMGYVNRSLLEYVANFQRPCVLLGNIANGEPMDSNAPCAVVRTDPLAMGYQATQHLIKQGYRRIGFFCREIPTGLWYERWLCGYRYAHFDHDLPIDQSLIHTVGVETQQSVGQIVAPQILAMKDKPTAYVLPDHAIAQTFLDEMNKASHPVAPNRVVIGADLQMAERLGLDAYPLITEDYNLLARTSLDVLMIAIKRGTPAQGQVTLPFHAYNFSEGDSSSTSMTI